MIMYELIDRYVKTLIKKSTPEKTAWNIERIRQGKPSDWNYIDGCMLTALMSMTDITGDRQYADFAERVVDHFVQPDGAIDTYQPEKHSLDDIKRQPRTEEGSFWHKQIYPNQVWLDGLYMAQPFAALYQKEIGNGDYSDVLHQLRIVRDRMRDAKTGLYYHGYDASRKAFWADPVTGLSKGFWLRSLGWFSVALADLLEILPDGSDKQEIANIFIDLMHSLLAYADPETGMYYQVVDQGQREGNYLESSGSSMIAYAMLKGARLNILGKEYAVQGQKTFDGIMSKYLTVEGEELRLDGICLVAGLGPENNRRRDGTFAYYISEPVVCNDAKGVAPFVLAYTEVKRLPA